MCATRNTSKYGWNHRLALFGGSGTSDTTTAAASRNRAIGWRSQPITLAEFSIAIARGKRITERGLDLTDNENLMYFDSKICSKNAHADFIYANFYGRS